MDIKKIMKENKRNSNYFLDTLKTGNKEKLEEIFKEAKKNDINLFNYIGFNKDAIECIVVYAMKSFKNKTLYSKNNLKDFIIFLKDNGFDFTQKEFKRWDDEFEKTFEYYHIKNLYNADIEFYDFNIISGILLKVYTPEFLKINIDDEFVISINRSFSEYNTDLLNLVKNMYFNGVPSLNIFKLNHRFLDSLFKEKLHYTNDSEIENNINLFKVFKKQLMNNEVSDNTLSYFAYLLENKKENDFIVKFYSETNISKEEFKKWILMKDKFNINLSVKPNYFGEIKEKEKESFRFLERYDANLFANYINKIVCFNNHMSTDKIKLNGVIEDKNNRMKIFRYFHSYYFKEMEGKNQLLIKGKEIIDFLKTNELIPGKESIGNMFNIIENRYSSNEYAISLEVFDFILSLKSYDEIKSFIPDIKKGFNENKFKENPWSKDNIKNKVIRFINKLENEELKEFFKDISLKNTLKLLSSENISKKVLDCFPLKDVLNYKIIMKNDNYNVYGDDVGDFIKNYMKNDKKIDEETKIKINDLVSDFVYKWRDVKESKKLLNIEIEKILLHIQILNTETSPRIKKRL